MSSKRCVELTFGLPCWYSITQAASATRLASQSRGVCTAWEHTASTDSAAVMGCEANVLNPYS